MPAKTSARIASLSSGRSSSSKVQSGNRKRIAPTESDDDSTPPPKRTRAPAAKPSVTTTPRTSTRKITVSATKKIIRTKKAAPTVKIASTRVPKPLPPFLNDLPVAASHPRPARQLFVWGNSDMGELGLGPDVTGDFPKPKLHTWFDKGIKEGIFGEDGAGIEQVVCGGMHTLVIDETGKVWSWGVNDDAALGRVTENVPDPADPTKVLDPDELQSTPHPLQSLVDEGFRAVSVAAGDSVSAAINETGDLRVWGSFRANEGTLGFTQNVETVHQSRRTAVVETIRKRQYLPMKLPFLSSPKLKFTSLAIGTNHVLALTVYGEVYIWGAGEQGQLGRKILDRRKGHGLTPEKLAIKNVVLIGAGSYHSFAVDSDGDVFGWGLNSMGQVGVSRGVRIQNDVVDTPRFIEELCSARLGNEARVVQIAGGEHHTLFRTSDGRVFACGRCNGGQLGLPENHPAFKPVEGQDSPITYIHSPTLIPFPEPMSHIAVGIHNNLALSTTGQLYTWGEGQLGLGEDVEEQRTPVVIGGRPDGKWVGVGGSLGGQHCVGVFTRKPVMD